MNEKSIYFVVLATVMSLVGSSAMAELIAYYPFNEGQGTATVDATGNGNEGTFDGDVQWVAGYKGGAVRFDTAGERIVIGPLDPTARTNAMTLAAWINWEGSGSTIAHQGIIGKRLGWPTDGSTVKWFWETTPTGDLIMRADYNGGGTSFGWGNGVLADYANEWTHVAVTWEDEAASQYINGEEVSSGTVTLREAANDTPVTIGCVASDNTETFIGIIDEVQFYDVALTTAELEDVMRGDIAVVSSSSPVPSDTATDVQGDVILSWAPGDYAAAHDVYFGTDANAVSDATVDNPMGVLVGPGQDANVYDPDGLLEFDQTYYWRVDEVNAPPDSTVYPGVVWSFTTEPVLYTVQGIVATASTSAATGSGQPEALVNGAGLTDGLHGNADATMWSGKTPVGEPAWLQFDFDRVYKLFGMHIWNYNGIYEYVLGFGLKDVTIEYATEPNEWVTWGDLQLARATGLETYAGQHIDLDGIAAQSIRIDVNSVQYGGPQPGLENEVQAGLSEIQFLYKPVVAREPQPEAGATDVDPAVVLSWRPGREAESHQVQFSADEQAVIDGAALVDTVSETSFSPGSLDLGTSYFWRIDEANEATVPSLWAGDVWDFTTREYIIFEGFETYTDDPDNEVFSFWIDGYDILGNGALVGHDMPPYCEQKTVHGGAQAMPFYYDNTEGVAHSEAVYTFSSGQDWTAYGADTFSLHFKGDPPAFVEDTPGNITMSGVGADIYELTDEFRFAYRQLTGDGSITARIDSIENTNEWAKAGLMMRATLEVGAMQAHMIGTPSNRVEWMPRAEAGTDAVGTATDADSTPLPQWVRLTRVGDVFTGEYSSDGVTWQTIADTTPETIAMPDTIYVGLVVSSHTNAPCLTEFSAVTTTGNATGQWQLAAVGADQPTGNDLDTLYVTVEDSSGNRKTVPHPSPAAVGASLWTQWPIPLSDLTAAGVNVKSVKKIYIGVGDKAQPSQDAAGLIYVDDLGYGHPVQ